MFRNRIGSHCAPRQSSRALLGLVVVCLGLHAAPAPAAVIFVNAARPANGDGTSWATAFRDLQPALTAAQSGDELWIAAGTYRPDRGPGLIPGTKTVAFQLRSGVGLYGGFLGNEASRPQRNPVVNLTILSGDLNGDDGAGGTPNLSDNSLRIVVANGTAAGTIVDGVTIRGAGGEASAGGGVTCAAGQLVLVNCIITANRAESGAGLFCDAFGILRLERCQVLRNSASDTGGGYFGSIFSDLLAINSTFSGNYAAQRGAGLFAISGTRLSLANCTVVRNTAGGLGGGVFAENTNPIVRNSILYANQDSEENVVPAQLRGISATPAVRYSCIQGIDGTFPGPGNIGDDPRFVSLDGPDDAPGTSDDDLSLRAGSPCIDAGENASVPGTRQDPNIPISEDLAGRPRFVDDPEAPDVGAGTPPLVDIGALEYQADCNNNGVLDSVDIAMGTSEDCSGNGIPDECEPDCNGNEIPDTCDIAAGTSGDCDSDGVPDECETDCDSDGVPDVCELADGSAQDCNGNLIPDNCDIASGVSTDCDGDEVPDECQTGGDPGADCNGNETPDVCEIVAGQVSDCDGNGVPDECDLSAGGADCNGNEALDACDIANGISPDCNGNGVPDECDVVAGTSPDCNGNGVPDECDVAGGVDDCNSNGVPDDCDIASGAAQDCNGNGTPDECEADCNANGVPDDCDITAGTSPDCNANGIPDECDIASDGGIDCDDNGVPDSCDIDADPTRDCDENGVLDSCETLFTLDETTGPVVGFGTGAPVTLLINDAPIALETVTIEVEAISDLAALLEWVDIELNGQPIARLFEQGGADCPATPNRATVLVDPAQFNGLVAGGSATLVAIGSAAVSPTVCPNGYLALRVTYAATTQTDCNQNGSPDVCDIRFGLSYDRNRNDIPDECEGLCPGDINNDQQVSLGDLGIVFSCWNQPCGDLDGDGTTNLVDLAILFANWERDCGG